MYIVHCTSYDEYIVCCFLIKCFWCRSGRERLSRALADIPLAVVLLGLTRSLSNANIVANTAYQKVSSIVSIAECFLHDLVHKRVFGS